VVYTGYDIAPYAAMIIPINKIMPGNFRLSGSFIRLLKMIS
jgi:hypothetical protein